MAEHSRYHVSDEKAGINKSILKNKLGIKSKKKLDSAETLLLADTYAYFFELLKEDKVKFDLSLLFTIHKYFLEHLYDWAGKVRTVNISKDGMMFAPIKYVDQSLKTFAILIKKNLPSQINTKDEIAKKLAVIHNEFNIIHPFREGNGRTIRLFLDLIVVSIGYDPIDWSKTQNSEYIRACIQGFSNKQLAMIKIIKRGLKKSK